MTAVEIAQTLLALIVALFLLRTLERYLQQRNPNSTVGSALEYLIGP